MSNTYFTSTTTGLTYWIDEAGLATLAPEEYDEGPCCSICDGLGHGYVGGAPCPLEVMDYSDEPWWAI